MAKGIKWSDVAKKVGLSKEWVTAACLGPDDARQEAGRASSARSSACRADEKKWLMVVPYKGSLPTAVPTDPLIYRFYELVSVYGTTFKELIHEEFGDGIMSRHRLQDGPAARARPEGRPRVDHDERQVPALQDLLTRSRDCGPAGDAASLGGVILTDPLEFA